MEKIFDIAVIGAGMFGSAAAKYLSLSNANIALIGLEEPANKSDALSNLAFGAHYDQARITRRLGWDEVWATTDSRSMNRFRNIESESGISFFHECGSLVLMANSIAHRTDSILKQCHNNSIPIERMSSEAVEYYWPYIKTPAIIGGVEGLFEDRMAGYLNPRQLIRAQMAIFERCKGILIRGAVIGVIKNVQSNLWKISVTQNGKTELIYAEKILIAAGAFVNHNNLLPNGCKLELYAFTEPNLLFEIDKADVELMHAMPAMITVDPEDTGDNNMSIYLLPPIKYPDDKWYVRIGPGMQPIVKQLYKFEQMREWCIQQQITIQQREFLMRMMKMLLPNLTAKSIKESCCIIEKTSTKYPYIGQINDDSSLNVVVGGNGHGARGSDEIGRLAANIVLENKWDFPIEKSKFKPILCTANQPCSKNLVSKPPFGLC